MKVSIIIPVFNESKTIRRVIDAVIAAPLGFDTEKEIIVVDDGSSDDTPDILRVIREIKVISVGNNFGKGASVKRGFEAATGDFIVIQDADLEYDTKDISSVLEPLMRGVLDVVFGDRFHGEKHTVIYKRNYVGNKFLTFFSNLCTGLRIGDMEVGYKAFRKEVVDSFKSELRSKRFGIEPEIVCRVARGRDKHGKRWRVGEVPVNYYGRTYEEGKKIHWWDGLKAIFVIIYFSFF